jgi:hypothetical protein
MSEVPTPAATGAAASALATPAWLMTGWGRTVPGALVAGHGRLAFLLAGDGPLFDVPVAAVTDVTWPWHWFGGGVRLRAAGTPYKITFVLPAGAEPPAPALLDDALAFVSLVTGAWPTRPVAGALDVRRGRGAGRRWREVLPAA